MDKALHFNEVLEAVDQLSADEQETLVEVIRRRLAERRRSQIVADVDAARREYAKGECREMSADDLMREIISSSSSTT